MHIRIIKEKLKKKRACPYVTLSYLLKRELFSHFTGKKNEDPPI
jgi:hypothetical protein